MSRTNNTRPHRLRTPEQQRNFWHRWWIKDWDETKELSGFNDRLAELALMEGLEEVSDGISRL